MTNPPPNWAFVLAGFASILAPLLGTASAAAGCDPAERETVSISAPLSVASEDMRFCKVIELKSTITVQDGGRFVLRDSLLRFAAANPPPHVLVTGGSFDMEAGSVMEPKPQGGAGVRVTFAPASAGRWEDAHLREVATLEIRSSTVELVRVDIESAPATALKIESASPTFTDLTVRNAGFGVEVLGVSQPTFLRATTADIGTIGLSVAQGARVASEASQWGGDDAAIRIVGEAQVVHTNGTFGGSGLHAKLESGPSGRPRLYLNGTSFDDARLDLQAGAYYESNWLVRLRVRTDDARLGPSGIQVALRNATQAVKAELVTDSAGLTPPVVLPDRARQAPGAAYSHNPYTALISFGHSANASTVVFDRNRLDDPAALDLRYDDDQEPPEWPNSGAALSSSNLGYSSDGNVVLNWNSATEHSTDQNPNRRVSHYEVFTLGPLKNSVENSPTTTLQVGDLAGGRYEFRVRPVDLAGNKGNLSNPYEVLVDREPPLLQYQVNRTHGPQVGHFNAPFTLRLTASDNASGLANIEYKVAGLHASFQPFAQDIVFDTDGAYNVTIRATDRAGGATERLLPLVLDRRPPQPRAQLNPQLPDGRDGWHTTPPELTIGASDAGASGVHQTRYRFGTNGVWANYTTSLKLKPITDQAIEVEVTDGAGNRAFSTLRVPIDPYLPTLAVRLNGTAGSNDWYVSPLHIEAEAQDNISGIESYEYRVNDGLWVPFESPLTLDHRGVRAVALRANDHAGLSSPEERMVVQIDPEPPAPPAVRWIPVEGGMVLAEWDGAPPVDLVSGIAQVSIDHRRGDDVGKRFPVDVSQAAARVGPLAKGAHQFRVSVADRAGNEAHTLWMTVNVTDSLGGLLSHPDAIVVRGRTHIEYNPPDGMTPAEVALYVDDEFVDALGGPPFKFEWDTRAFADGAHIVRLVAKDQAGRVAEDQRIYHIHNSYGNVVGDHAVSFAAAVAALGAATAGAAIGAVRFRGGKTA